MVHTASCQKFTKRYEAHKAQFEARYPRYCRHCHGWGVTGTGMVDRDTGFVDADPCCECVEKGVCPLCGEEALDEYGEKCYACNWKLEVGEGLEEEPECDCWQVPDEIEIQRSLQDHYTNLHQRT